MIVIEFAGAPQGKGRPRFRMIRTRAGATFGSAYTPSKTRKYEQALAQVAAEATRRMPLLEGPLSVTVHAKMPIPESWPQRKKTAAIAGTLRPTTKPDADNILKLLDALNEIVWNDDKQIVDVRIIKTYAADPMLRIEVEQIAPGFLAA